MSGALRIVFTWLLAVALPLQGSAAASMTLCGTLGEGAPAVRHVHDAARRAGFDEGFRAGPRLRPRPWRASPEPGTRRRRREVQRLCRVLRVDGHRRRGLHVDLGRPVRVLCFARRDRGFPLLHRGARATSPNFLLRLTPRARSGRPRPIATSWRDATRGLAMTSPACALHNRRSSDVFTCHAAGCAAPGAQRLRPCSRRVLRSSSSRGGPQPRVTPLRKPLHPRLPPPRSRLINTTCRRCPGTT